MAVQAPCRRCADRTLAFVPQRNPEDRYTFAVLPNQDLFPYHYPDVAIQLPMFNETWVCQQVIDCCSRMEWPRDRLWSQVSAAWVGVREPTTVQSFLFLF